MKKLFCLLIAVVMVLGCVYGGGGLVYAATADQDYRARPGNPVAIEKETLVLDYSEDDDETSTTITKNGVVKQIVYTIPQLDGAVTLTFKLKNEDGAELYSQASIAENTTTVTFPSSQPLIAGTTTLYFLVSGAQTHDFNLTVTLYFE